MISFSTPEDGPERIMDMTTRNVERFADALDDALNHPINGIERARQTIVTAPITSGLAALDLVTTAAREYLTILRNAETPV